MVLFLNILNIFISLKIIIINVMKINYFITIYCIVKIAS